MSDDTTHPRMNAVGEPDYDEVFEDLKHLETHGQWRDGIPEWTYVFSRELGVYVGHPAILFEAWKFVAKKAMKELGA